MMQTKQQDLGEQLQKAVLQQAMDAGCASSSGESEKRTGIEKTRPVSPRSGAPTPPGRPKGVRNKLTNLRDAVLEAFDRVGGADYLVRLAEGTQSDRAAFVSLMNKVLPTQINQQVDGGIKLELSWLGGRNIGTTTAQIPEQRTQVLDLERDNDGQYRIKHPAAGDGQGPAGPEGAGGAQGAG